MKKQQQTESVIPVSPSSSRHPSHPEALRHRPKPKRTPVMRRIVTPPPFVYPAPFRGRA